MQLVRELRNLSRAFCEMRQKLTYKEYDIEIYCYFRQFWNGEIILHAEKDDLHR